MVAHQGLCQLSGAMGNATESRALRDSSLAARARRLKWEWIRRAQEDCATTYVQLNSTAGNPTTCLANRLMALPGPEECEAAVQSFNPEGTPSTCHRAQTANGKAVGKVGRQIEALVQSEYVGWKYTLGALQKNNFQKTCFTNWHYCVHHTSTEYAF